MSSSAVWRKHPYFSHVLRNANQHLTLKIFLMCMCVNQHGLRRWSSWNWSDRRLWAVMWVLGTWLMSSSKAVSTQPPSQLSSPNSWVSVRLYSSESWMQKSWNLNTLFFLPEHQYICQLRKEALNHMMIKTQGNLDRILQMDLFLF